MSRAEQHQSRNDVGWNALSSTNERYVYGSLDDELSSHILAIGPTACLSS